MAFYLIGLGLSINSITVEALNILKTCDKVFVENYTVDFPYKIKDLEKNIEIKINELDRQKVEDESILKEAKREKVALLVYGDCLSATTHIQLITSCKSQKIPYEILHNTSILTAVSNTGLQLYKFGKTTSMPNWKEHTNKPTSFVNYIKENKSIGAHTLILTDIGLNLKDAIMQLKESSKKENLKLDKIIVLTNAGTKNQKILYDTPDKIENKEVNLPFCIIIPSKLNHVEEEALGVLKG